MHMICNLTKWCEFLKYDGFKSHVNVTEGLKNFAEEGIKVGKEEAGTRDLNQAYYILQANQYKAQTRQLPEMTRQKVHGPITQWQIIIIVYKSI